MINFLEGFTLQAGLILALGAQNIFLIETGIHKKNRFLGALTCSVCDVFLILMGVLGTAVLFNQFPQIETGITVLGVVFLGVMAGKNLLNAGRGKRSASSQSGSKSSGALVLHATFCTLLNPHAYLDAFVLIGGYSAKFNTLTERLEFGLGASLFSVIWFFLLVQFSSMFSSLLTAPRQQRAFSLATGILLLTFSWRLCLDLLESQKFRTALSLLI